MYGHEEGTQWVTVSVLSCCGMGQLEFPNPSVCVRLERASLLGVGLGVGNPKSLFARRANLIDWTAL